MTKLSASLLVKRTSLSLLSLIITALSFEVSLRLVAQTNTRLAYYLNNWQSRRLATVIDGETGANLLKPAVTFNELNPEGAMVSFTGDSLGLRNNCEFTNQRIIAMGDSFTAGSGVNLDDRWSTTLGRHLDIPVYNVGANLSGPRQQLLLLKKVINKSASYPDLVIWMIYSGNDIADSYGFLTGQFRRSLASNVIAANLCDWFYGGRLVLYLARILNRAAGGRTTGERYQVLSRDVDFFVLKKASKDYYHSQEWIQGWDDVKTVIGDLAREMRGLGKKLLVVYAPSKEEVFGDILYSQYGVEPHRILSFDKQLLSWCEESRVECMSLKTTLANHANNGEMTYFQYDGHWNADGHQIVSAMIQEQVHQRRIF